MNTLSFARTAFRIGNSRLYLLNSFFALLLISFNGAWAAAPEVATDRGQAAVRFEEARKQYDAGQFNKAIDLYKSLLDEGYADFALHYNLGNAYFKTGAIGPCILHYEKARKLEPNDANVLHNLELAFLRQQDKRIEPLPQHFFNRVWSGLTGLFTQTGWAWFALISTWAILGGLSLIWWSISQGWRKAGLGLLIAAILGLGFSLTGGFGRRSMDAKNRFAIIMTPSAVLKSAPSASATDLFILREGFKLRITDQTGTWTEVTLPDGNVGWVEAGSIEEI